ARVLADQHRGTAAMRRRDVGARQHLARAEAQLQHEVGRDRKLPDPPSNPIGPEILSRHAPNSIHTLIASTVSLTSWTRTRLAPFCTASRAAATLPAV